MRFFDTEPRPLYLSELRDGLREIDPSFDLDGWSDASGSGFLMYDGATHAEVTIDSPEHDYFDSDTEMLKSHIQVASGPGRAQVEIVLRDAKRMICLRVLSGGRDAETNLSRLDVLWDWLFAHRSGLLHAEGEGFYKDETLILAIK